MTTKSTTTVNRARKLVSGDQRTVSPKVYRDEKLTAGIRASETNNYLEAVKQFSLIKPDTTTSLYLGGCARFELKYDLQTEEAIKDFTKCIRLSSQNEQLPFSLEVWYKRALAYHQIRKYDEAIQDYSEFIRRCRSNGKQTEYELHRGLIGRSITYQAMNELDMSLIDVNEAIQLTNHNDPYYLLCRASIYASRYERKQAIDDINTANQLGCEKDFEAIFQRANVYVELEKHTIALEDYQKALKISSKSNEQSDVCTRAGICAYKINSKSQAYQWFERALTLNPCNAQAYYYLGVIQREKGQYKEALKNLNHAHEYSPKYGDILIERALVHQHLGDSRAAEQDEKQAKNLNSSTSTLVTILTERIKQIRNDKDRINNPTKTHYDLAIAYDGLINQKRNRNAKLDYYKIAVLEYRAAIKADVKIVYPQAHALLALCQRKLNNFNESHEIHLEFYKILSKHKGAIYHWKNYLVEIEEQMRSGQLEPHLNETSVSQLIHMEVNRRKYLIDLETLANDQQDLDKNQLNFYEQLRIDLIDLLTTISILNLESELIIDNAEDATNKIARILELICSGEKSYSTIESTLNRTGETNIKLLKKTDWLSIKNKLHSIGNVDDLADQLDVAQLVARHICTRYYSQLICLKVSSSIDEVEIVETKSSSLNCCNSSSNNNWLFSKEENLTTEQQISENLSTFAIAYIIFAINNQFIQYSSSEKSTQRDSLATTLVLTICQAYFNSKTINSRLPIDRTRLMKILNKTDLSRENHDNLPNDWHLYSFFRSPGIYYRSDTDNGKIYYYKSDPLMQANNYGYRLGTFEEVQELKKNIKNPNN